MLVLSSALGFVTMVSFVKIIIERSFVPELPFVKPLEKLLFPAVGRGERPVRNEVYAVVVHFLVHRSAIRFMAFLL